MSERIWEAHYPASVPKHIDTSAYPSLVAMIDERMAQFAKRTAYTFMGQDLSFGRVDAASRLMAAYLQSLGLKKGDRVAVMMPNLPQYAVAAAAILRAGLVLVNVNPLYTARELEHQLKDSGAKAIVIVENFAATLQQCIGHTDVKHTVLVSIGDELGFLKGALVNFVVRNVKKMVPAFSLPQAVRYKDALAAGARAPFTAPQLGPDDVAVLQYTGGTTGVPKGATLLHRNLLANCLQAHAWYQPVLQQFKPDEQPTMVCALPLYHIFAFTSNFMVGLYAGGRNILIVNPKDLKDVFKTLSNETIHVFPAVNTLFNAMAHHEDFGTVNWSNLKLSVGGGMAVQAAVAKLWLEKTGCAICEGYGLSETSPVVSCNPTDSKTYTGTIGLPMPDTDIALLDDAGQPVPLGQPGEISVKGPQVMAGYWQKPEETAKVMTPDGYFKTGDIGVMDERGYVRIVDRKKDMILVSGFNVYPNEIEDVVAAMPGVLEVGAVGVPDEHSGEVVKVVIVRSNPALTEDEVRDYLKDKLTGYKRPRIVEFRTELPKTNVGKVLRRELRDKPKA